MTIKRSQFLLSIALHIVVLAVLLFGVPQCSRKIEQQPIVEAVLIQDSPSVTEKSQPAPPPAAEPPPELPKPKPTPEPPKPDPEKLRQQAAAAEAQTKAEADKKAQDLLLAQQKAEEQARVVAEAKAKRDAEDAQRKAAEEQLKQQAAAEEAKRKADEEAKRKAEEDLKRKVAEEAERQRKADEKARADALAAQLKAEEDARMAAVRAAAQKTWYSAISEALRRNWLRPPDNQTDFACIVEIELLPNGVVKSARITTSCGSTVLDDSVISAIYKASPLPLPSEPTAFISKLPPLRFRPPR
jgi:colicin import membrane protein